MKRLIIRTGFVVLLLPTKSYAQAGAVIPSADAGHVAQASCVILKRMGRADRTKSRLYSLGIGGKQFRYVEGELPEGFSLQGKMTDRDVRNLEARGAEVVVLESNYTSKDLQEARAGCRGGAAKTSNQAEANALPAPTSGEMASTPGSPPMGLNPQAAAPAPAPKPPNAKASTPKASDSAPPTGTAEAALLDVSSTPPEADVYVDERLSGQTPSTIILMPGDHKIVIKKSGFVVWKKKFNLPSGRTNVDAELVPNAK